MTQTHINGIILIAFLISAGTHIYLCTSEKSSKRSCLISGVLSTTLLLIIKFYL